MRVTSLVAIVVFGLSVAEESRAQAQASVKHVVVSTAVKGVTFKRTGWIQFAPARFGTELNDGDLLRFDLGASVVVVCKGYSTIAKASGPGIRPVPCAAAPPNQDWKDVPVIPTASIYTPWNGSADTVTLSSVGLLNTSMSWPAVKGADSYEIQMAGSDFKHRITTTDKALDLVKLIMEGKTVESALKSNAVYDLDIVPLRANKAIGLSPRAREALALTLSLIRAPLEAEIGTAIKDLDKLGLAPAVLSFLSSRLRARAGQYDQAITLLKTTQGFLKEPVLSRELGDIYLARGDEANALRFLNEARAAFMSSGDIVGQALVQEAIAKIMSKSSGTVGQAVVLLTDSRKTYERLGAKADAARVDAELAAIQGLTSWAMLRPGVLPTGEAR